MAALVDNGIAATQRNAARWIPLALLPGLAASVGPMLLPAWVAMWLLAIAIYAGLKLLTFIDAGASFRRDGWRAAAYLFLWPGMNIRRFLDRTAVVAKPTKSEWLAASGKLILGGVLFGLVAPRFLSAAPLVAGWIALAGIVFLLHFGAFHLLSLVWRRLGIDAPPIINAPLLATSLGDFWGRRWNIAFRDLSYEFVVKPYASRIGLSAATVLVFVLSGVIHDAVISIPAGSGYGGPTLYFVNHAAALLFERSRMGKRLGLGHGVIGWSYTALVSILPAGLLFHRPFIDNVVLPMLETLTRMGN